ncbi:hypothetical protein HPB52_025477 [Rhipicephalus sanguineus]|uniref:Uncharacterized protein n=1 Tax=Rhipicephalus sanguineus TaxID=34632 RepID=A0A9D4YRP1_RHISA|nr:hypothetical protein HPB52_025477 [Rhipicephalus sanguineus]
MARSALKHLDMPKFERSGLAKPLCKKCGKENPERWLPRLPYTMLFVVGGWSNGQALSDIQAFDPLANRWVRHENASAFEPRAYHAVAVYGRRVFVIGGMQERKYLRSTMSYDMDSCEWKVESSMHVPRAYVAAVTLGHTSTRWEDTPVSDTEV